MDVTNYNMAALVVVTILWARDLQAFAAATCIVSGSCASVDLSPAFRVNVELATRSCDLSTIYARLVIRQLILAKLMNLHYIFFNYRSGK